MLKNFVALFVVVALMSLSVVPSYARGHGGGRAFGALVGLLGGAALMNHRAAPAETLPVVPQPFVCVGNFFDPTGTFLGSKFVDGAGNLYWLPAAGPMVRIGGGSHRCHGRR